MQIKSLLVFCFCLLVVIRAQVKEDYVTIYGLVKQPDLSTRYSQPQAPQTVSVTLNSGLYTTYPNEYGYFQFNNIPQGKYVLEVHSNLYLYEKAILNYYANNQTPGVVIQKQNPITMVKEESMPVEGTIEIKALEKIIYFDKVEQFNYTSLLYSQYSFIAIIVLSMYVCSKYMPNLEEMQNQANEQAQAAQQQK